MNAMYSVEQVNVPPELGTIMKQFTKAVLRDHPVDVYKYGANFFSVLSGRSAPFDQDGQLTDEGNGDDEPLSPSEKQRESVSTPVAVAAQRDQEMDQEGHPYTADEEQQNVAAPQSDEEQQEAPEQDDAEVEEGVGAMVGGEDIVLEVLQKYNEGGQGMTRVELLPDLLADLRSALELSEEDLPPAEEVVTLLKCENGSVDLLELKQLLFESEEE